MDCSLNVMTLNCWGIRIPVLKTPHITERFAAIAELVNRSDYDVIAFQEVFDINDYVHLSCKILDKLPYNHYFYGGLVGSGLCIFSRYPIAETLYQEFPLNGQAHKVLHGDWYASKGCGLAILKVKDMTVNVYTSHMIARYNHLQPFDEYAGHRAVQAFTFSQFVKHTSVSCDAVIVMGDFNTAATETPYRILRSNAVLNDAWLVKNGECAEGGGSTSDALHNCFRTNYSSGILPHGERIDYIMYRANERIDLQLFECRVIKDKIPGTNLDYSDHQPVVARMSIKKNITAGQVPMPDSDVRLSCLQELIDTVDKGSARARYSKYFYFVMSLICLMMLLVSRERYLGDFGDTFHTVLEIIQGVMAIMATVSIWMSAISSRWEERIYRRQKCDLEILVKGSKLAKVKKFD